MMLTATISALRSWKPCGRYDEARIRALADGRATFTALDILSLDIPSNDKLWVVLRKELISARTLRIFACACAERVLPIFERKHKDDKRPRLAIEMARRYADGQATRRELAAAGAAAWATAGAAAWATARAAARDAAWAAARDAAWATAWAAARDTAGAAAWDAARAAAWATAGAAAWATAGATARDAAWDAERHWQLNQLRELLREHDRRQQPRTLVDEGVGYSIDEPAPEEA